MSYAMADSFRRSRRQSPRMSSPDAISDAQKGRLSRLFSQHVLDSWPGRWTDRLDAMAA
jgi:hypothetical protein